MTKSTPKSGAFRLLPLVLALAMTADALGASRPQVAPLKKGPARRPAAESEEAEAPSATEAEAAATATEKPATERSSTRSTSGGGGDDESGRKAWKKLAGRVDTLEKQLEKMRKENGELKDQVKLLYSIVNKLAGLQQGN